MSTALSIGRPDEPAAVRSLAFDDVVVTYVVDGVLTTRPEKFFPGTPRDAWDHLCTPTGELLMSTGGLLVHIGGTTVLIDAGVGTMTSSVGSVAVDCGSLIDVLAGLAVPPEDIDTLAFTHLHFDHAGWAFVDGAKVFANARYTLAAQEWAPYAAGRGGGGDATPWHVISALASGSEEMDLFFDGEEIVPGIKALVAPGHTPGHTAYVITSRTGRRLIAFGDAFHSPAQLTHPDWMSIADFDGPSVIAARHRLLAQLSVPGTIAFGCHFGDQPFGQVAVDDYGRTTWEPVPSVVTAPPPRTDRKGGSK
jgi:glyoxylase-like metal-dependent hydrolase (beta-lactamase superfamily II)